MNLVTFLSSWWFWALYGMIGIYANAGLRRSTTMNIVFFKDFWVFYLGIGFLVLGFTLEYSITNALFGGIFHNPGNLGHRIYLVIITIMGFLLVRTLLKSENKYFKPVLTLILMFCLGNVGRIIYEGAVL